jgi:CDGSH-type Zn-finger protein
MALNKEPYLPRQPFVVQETKGTKYYCVCGLSDNQPYCDGSHKVTHYKPIKVEIENDRRVAYCGCRLSDELPFCDGSHSYDQ